MIKVVRIIEVFRHNLKTLSIELFDSIFSLFIQLNNNKN